MSTASSDREEEMTNILVHIPQRELEHFWEETPEAHEEWWKVSARPRELSPGDFIYFEFGQQLVARARVDRIVEDELVCQVTGRVWSGVHVVWKAEDFERLEEPQPSPKVQRGFRYLREVK